MHLTEAKAAKELGICRTTIKKACRKLNIKSWRQDRLSKARDVLACVLQCVAVCCSVLQHVRCSVLQCVAVCYSARDLSAFQYASTSLIALQYKTNYLDRYSNSTLYFTVPVSLSR